MAKLNSLISQGIEKNTQINRHGHIIKYQNKTHNSK